jgi:M6 family metalloprotease-like protein
VLRVAVIAAQFSDINATVSISQIKQSWAVVNQYYQEVSYGAVKLQVDVYGWYTLPYPEAYYGKDCLGIDDADCSGSDGSWHIAQDAMSQAQRDFNVNNYDYFSFVHSGDGEESSGVKNDVWSVTYLGGVWIQTTSKSITKFSIIPELEAGGAVPIGVYAHEFGHQLGLPDMYNTQTGRTIMGPWTLMDAGLWNGNPPGSSPAHFDSWCKTQLGFISGSTLAIANSGQSTSYTIDPSEVPSTNIHAVEVPVSPTLPPSQYYLVEVRDQIGFDQALPSTGVLILYVDETLSIGRVKVMNANPTISGLNGATWTVGQTFTDSKNNIAISVTGKAGNSYQVKISEGTSSQNQNQNQNQPQNQTQSYAQLSITKLFTQPSDITLPNTTVTLYIDISNQGTLNVTNVPIEIDLDGQQYATTQATVNANSTAQASTVWTSVSGSHLFKVIIDPNDTITEPSRAGNQATFTVYVGPSLGPTLTIGVPTDLISNSTSVWVKINGVQYNLNSTNLQENVPAGRITLQIESIVNSGLGTRELFSGWSDGSTANPRQLTITNDTQINALFNPQYLLTINGNHGTTSQGGWYNANGTATVVANNPSNVTQDTSRLIFIGWSGDYNSTSTSLSIIMSRPMTVQANWLTQYYVTIVSTTGSPSGSGWYNEGTTANVTVEPLVEFTNGTRYVFTGWNQYSSSQSPSLQIRINAPTRLEASWERQYLVQVQSSYGSVQGSGWYNAGSFAKISVQPEIDFNNRTRLLFSGWTGDFSNPDSNTTVQVQSPKVINASWTTQYELSFNVKINGVPDSSVVALNIENQTYHVRNNNGYYSGWYNRNDQITPTVNNTVTYFIFVYSFSGWQDTNGATVQTPITVSAPGNYTAQYTLSGISFSCFPNCLSNPTGNGNISNNSQHIQSPSTLDWLTSLKGRHSSTRH